MPFQNANLIWQSDFQIVADITFSSSFWTSIENNTFSSQSNALIGMHIKFCKHLLVGGSETIFFFFFAKLWWAPFKTETELETTQL